MGKHTKPAASHDVVVVHDGDGPDALCGKKHGLLALVGRVQIPDAQRSVLAAAREARAIFHQAQAESIKHEVL